MMPRTHRCWKQLARWLWLLAERERGRCENCYIVERESPRDSGTQMKAFTAGAGGEYAGGLGEKIGHGDRARLLRSSAEPLRSGNTTTFGFLSSVSTAIKCLISQPAAPTRRHAAICSNRPAVAQQGVELAISPRFKKFDQFALLTVERLLLPRHPSADGWSILCGRCHRMRHRW